ncbi:MAG: oligosaccharide flippase family protein [Actinomycetota bacterium]
MLSSRLLRVWLRPRGAVRARLTRHTLVLFVALSVVNAANYVFHVVMSRVLGPESYGALAGILSAFVWIAICAGALQLVVAREVAVADAGSVSRSRGDLGWLLQAAVRYSVAPAIVLLAGTWWISRFLNLGTIGPAVLLAAYVVPASANAAARGMLQGQLRFAWLGIVMGGTTVMRLMAAVIFVSLGWGITGAVAASVVAETLGLILALVPLRRDLAGWRTEVGRRRALGKEIILAASYLGAFWAIVNMDTFLVRHYFANARSGFYASAAVAARSTLFFPAAIAMVCFPYFSTGAAQADARRLLKGALAMVAVLSGGGALVLASLGPRIVGVLFGDQYLWGAHLVGTLGAAMAVLAVVNVLVHYHLAVQSRVLWVLVAAAVVQVGAIHYLSFSLQTIAVAVLSVALGLMGWLLWAAYGSSSRERALSKGQFPSAGDERLSSPQRALE